MPFSNCFFRIKTKSANFSTCQFCEWYKNSLLHIMRVKSHNSMHFHHYTDMMSRACSMAFDTCLLCLARLHLMYLQNLCAFETDPQSDTETVFTYSCPNFTIWYLDCFCFIIICKISKMDH